MPRTTARPGSRLTLNRFYAAVAACALSYLTAYLVLLDFIRWAGTDRADAAALGYIAATACLPVLIVTGFGGRAWRRGLLAVGALGVLAALGCFA